MRKTILTVLLFGILLNSFSQTTSFGFNAGFGETSNRHLYGDYQGKNLRFHNYGFSFIRSIKAHFGIGADLNYSLEGTKVYLESNIGVPIIYDATYRLQYFRFPLKAYYFLVNQIH